MSLATIYTVKSVNHPIVWVFAYDLEGMLVRFEVLDGQLSEMQAQWLFQPRHFPWHESRLQPWYKNKKVSIEKGEPDLSFEAFYNAYGYKIKKVVAKRSWDRLNRSDRMNALNGIRSYNNHLKRHPTKQKANPSTYLNQRYWEDDYGSI